MLLGGSKIVVLHKRGHRIYVVDRIVDKKSGIEGDGSNRTSKGRRELEVPLLLKTFWG